MCAAPVVNRRVPHRSAKGAAWVGACALAACGRGSHTNLDAQALTDAHHAVDAAVAAQPAPVVDAGPGFTPPTRIVALGPWVPVRREPRRDAPLAGYLRSGAVSAVEGMPAGREHCPVHHGDLAGGWYHLVGGGWVCVGGALAAPYTRGAEHRSVQPLLDAGMPYQYAVVYGSPNMYRAPPTVEELHIYESWRFQHDEPEAGTPEAPSTPTDTADTTPPVTTDTDPEAPPTAAPTTRRHGAAPATPDPAAPTATTPTTVTPDGEPRLRDLRGERGGPVIRRLLRGMYIALDRTVLSRSTGDRYWRTQSGGFVRTGPLSIVHNFSTFAGVPLTAEQGLPFAFMVSLTGSDYRITPNGHGASQHHRVPRFTAIPLTADPPLTIDGRTLYRTTEPGLAVDARNVRIAHLRPPPEGLAPDEKWLDVDLDEQILVAYEGARPVYVTLVSTGRRTDRHGDDSPQYETPAGSFRIRGKHITTTMDGDTAADGPYSIEDVPWAEYFYNSYALHGAFWHGNFGWRMSHGCVNLSPSDAQWLFFWTEPALPPGWHGVFANEQHPGTRVELHHGDAPTPRRPTI